MRYRARVSYDGTDFLGWQSQRGSGRTVQETLAAAFSTVLREEVKVLGAGRTDAGVHARGQVIAFDVTREIPDLGLLQRSVNGVLPPDVAVRALEIAPADFDPRRHAVRRAYRYRIWNQPDRSPLESRYAWHVPRPLDAGAMSRAAAALLGQQDFASFQGADKIARASVRRVDRSDVRRDGNLVVYWIEANAFVRHMVRNVVGQLVEVGLGRCSEDDFVRILAALDRGRAAPPAPPQGLFLEWVEYR